VKALRELSSQEVGAAAISEAIAQAQVAIYDGEVENQAADQHLKRFIAELAQLDAQSSRRDID
jgi:hypothetical protein